MAAALAALDCDGVQSGRLRLKALGFEIAGAFFSRPFIPTISFKPVENFRDEAKAMLAKAKANKHIKLCQTESAPRVSFETAERSAATA